MYYNIEFQYISLITSWAIIQKKKNKLGNMIILLNVAVNIVLVLVLVLVFAI
jgi:hypothetical protein